MSTVYVQHVARIRTLEAKLLRSQDWERIVNAATYEGALNEIKGRLYGVTLERNVLFDEAMALLAKEEQYLFSFCANIIPDNKMKRLLLLFPEITDRKKRCKEALLTGEASPLFVRDDIFWQNAWREIRKAYAVVKDITVVDAIMEGLFVHEVHGVVVSSSSKWLLAMLKILVDFANLKMWLRLKDFSSTPAAFQWYFLPHGEIDRDVLRKSLGLDSDDFFQSLRFKRHYSGLLKVWQDMKKGGEFELLDDFFSREISRWVKETIRIYDGPEPILGYLLMRRMEISCLRALLSGKYYNLPKETLKQFVGIGDV